MNLPDLGILGGRLPTKHTVGPFVIEFVSPVAEGHLCLDESVELPAVHELVPKTTLNDSIQPFCQGEVATSRSSSPLGPTSR